MQNQIYATEKQDLSSASSCVSTCSLANILLHTSRSTSPLCVVWCFSFSISQYTAAGTVQQE